MDQQQVSWKFGKGQLVKVVNHELQGTIGVIVDRYSKPARYFGPLCLGPYPELYEVSTPAQTLELLPCCLTPLLLGAD
jgi:hypothetical protein